jgi:hypothetical protein
MKESSVYEVDRRAPDAALAAAFDPVTGGWGCGKLDPGKRPAIGWCPAPRRPARLDSTKEPP